MINVHSNTSVILSDNLLCWKVRKFWDYNCLYCLSIITLEGFLPIVAHSRRESEGHHSSSRSVFNPLIFPFGRAHYFVYLFYQIFIPYWFSNKAIFYWTITRYCLSHPFIYNSKYQLIEICYIYLKIFYLQSLKIALESVSKMLGVGFELTISNCDP
jgi:hypothetical protein